MTRADELEKQLKISEQREKEESLMGESDRARREKTKELIKGFLESRKGFMMKNRYKIGNTTIYPTSKQCLKAKRREDKNDNI